MQTIETVPLVGTIDEAFTQEAVERLLATSAPCVEIWLHTFGGQMLTSTAIVGAIRLLQHRGVEVTVVALGCVASAGMMILQAASPGRRLAHREAQLLLHGGLVTLTDVPVAQVQDSAQLYANWQDALADLLARANTAGHNDPAMWREMLRSNQDWTYTAWRARAVGLIDEVIDGPSIAGQPRAAH